MLEAARQRSKCLIQRFHQALDVHIIAAGQEIPAPGKALGSAAQSLAPGILGDACDQFLADPNQAEVPVAGLLSEDYARSLRIRISPSKAMTDLSPPYDLAGGNTVYLCVVDKDRNAVSFINSLFNSFGCAFMGPKSGVMLHSRGQSFVVEPGHPNCIAPGKRPFHTRDQRCLPRFQRARRHLSANSRRNLPDRG